jgi:hypothetical protein
MVIGIRGEARTDENKYRCRHKLKPRTQQEMKMKTIAATAFALVLSTSFAFAQAGQAHGGTGTGWMNSFASRPGMNSGVRNSEAIEPGDFAVTGGLSNRTRAWNPTGQVDPGTSNSPAGNAGGE